MCFRIKHKLLLHIIDIYAQQHPIQVIINQRAVHRNNAFDGDQQDIIPRNQQNAGVGEQRVPTVRYQQNLPRDPSTDSIDVS